MDSFFQLCGDASSFPSNLVNSNKIEGYLSSYNAQIKLDEKRLFSERCAEGLTFWDYSSEANAFRLKPVETFERLKAHLGISPRKEEHHPRCRFLFVSAVGEDSRACLDITQEMLLLVFSVFQVMPEFLDFLFLFGYQTQAEDLYFSGFRQLARLESRDRGLSIPKFLWSGFELQVCYSLKSVEQSIGQPHWPWSIRQCAIHHTFDIEYGRANWIVVKGNKEVARRIRSATGSYGPNVFSSFDSIIGAFSAALYIHLMICEWSAENWRWYIKFLEQQLERLTQGAVTTNADVTISPIVGTDTMTPVHRRDTQRTQQTQRSRVFSFPKPFSRTATQATDSMSLTPFTQQPRTQTFTNPSSKKQPLPPGMTVSKSSNTKKPVRLDTWGQQTFAFSDLQEIQDLEEKANETVLVLRLNLNVMQQLGDHYTATVESHHSLKLLEEDCSHDLYYFRRRIHEIDSEINLHILRVEALLRKLSDRKTLLYGFLDYQNTQINKQVALDTQTSNQNVERMTGYMGKLARKTKTETVSMKIITLVTLFFLPGTFISVGRLSRIYLTLMSTDIVHWDNNKRNFQSEALGVYLYTSLPLTFVVFLIWRAYQYVERKKEKDRHQQHEATLNRPEV